MRITIILLACLLISSCLFAESKVITFPANPQVHDQAALQRGAKIFMNYCSGCHALRFLRYNRMANDLGLTTFDGAIDKDLLVSNLIFTQVPIHEPIKIAMPAADARQWFGIVPPDLSLTARERGADWIYTYLKSFYADNTRPFGSNNLLFPDVAMPNVLQPLSGEVIAVNNNNQAVTQNISHLLLVKPGKMNPAEFDSTLNDLVTFLVYVAEPAQLLRYRVGAFILLFLSGFLVVAYLLKRFYWQRLAKSNG